MQSEIKNFILKFLEKNNKNTKNVTNLLDENLLDSMGFLELISALEENFDIEIDFFDVDPVSFTDINSLSNLIFKIKNDKN